MDFVGGGWLNEHFSLGMYGTLNVFLGGFWLLAWSRILSKCMLRTLVKFAEESTARHGWDRQAFSPRHRPGVWKRVMPTHAAFVCLFGG